MKIIKNAFLFFINNTLHRLPYRDSGPLQPSSSWPQTNPCFRSCSCCRISHLFWKSKPSYPVQDPRFSPPRAQALSLQKPAWLPPHLILYLRLTGSAESGLWAYLISAVLAFHKLCPSSADHYGIIISKRLTD